MDICFKFSRQTDGPDPIPDTIKVESTEKKIIKFHKRTGIAVSRKEHRTQIRQLFSFKERVYFSVLSLSRFPHQERDTKKISLVGINGLLNGAFSSYTHNNFSIYIFYCSVIFLFPDKIVHKISTICENYRGQS